MCKAMSMVVTRTKVYWKLGMDSHQDIIKEFNLPDDPEKSVLIEISPKNNNYLKPDEWIFRVDNEDKSPPDWWKLSNEKMCWEAHKDWLKKLDKILVKKEIINPLELPKVKKITKEHNKLLTEWSSVCASVCASVWDSVGDSVRDSVRYSIWYSVRYSVRNSVGDSVRDSVGNSVWDSVRDSVWDSVRDSVWDSVEAYIGSFFNLPRWKYTEKIKTKKYPFQPAVELWEAGLVPSFDGKTWRLHSGSNAEVVFEISQAELQGDDKKNEKSG